MYFIVSMIFAIVVLTAPKGAEARKWRVTPTDLAGDYTQIIDQRSDKDVVVIYWIAPETMNPEMQNAEVYRAMLRENLIVGVAHGTPSNTGRLNFRVPEGLSVQTCDGKSRQPMAKESWPPMVSAFSAVIQNFMTQSLGQLGEGFHWFVFEGKGIESCGKGRFWVSYAGEKYNYDTPIPGCSSGGASK
jgi:hypothetical protein